ncbi:MAG: FAD/NAD(P)-binding protein [Ilumatobacteraceae bacterium]
MPGEGATMVSAAGGRSPVGPMVPSRYRVTDRRQENADSVTISLTPIDDPIDDAEPGQFTMLYAFGVGEVPISVSGCPRHEGMLMHTIRAVGATSRALCNLEFGSVVGVRGPFGVGWDVSSAEGSDVLIVGGGIGLAPLRPVVREVLAARERFGQVGVLIGARTPEDLLYADEVEKWRASPDVHVAVTVDVASPGWEGHVGLVTELLGELPFTPSSTTSFLCGPEVMIRVVAREILKSGATADRIRVSLERNMHCAVRQCGHCQLGPIFVCADGPVVTWATAADLLAVRRW